jgi:hypothetical protein
MKSLMKIFFILAGMITNFSFIFLIESCNHQDKENKKTSTEYWYLTNGEEEDKITTYPVNGKIPFHDSKDSLLSDYDFTYKSIKHSIKMYTNDAFAPIDGGILKYELDSIGIIYNRSTTWFNYGRLLSNNDSINSLVDRALEYIIMRPKLHCYHCCPPEGNNKFIPPKPN